MQAKNSGKADEYDDLEYLAHALKGNTLLIYWFMLRNNRSHSAREIQRRVKMSSSSLALHHLNKLMNLGLVSIDSNGRYVILRKVKPGLLSLFVGSGRLLIPRFIFYATFFSVLLFVCAFLFWYRLDTTIFLLITSLSLSSIAFWTESFRVWRMKLI